MIQRTGITSKLLSFDRFSKTEDTADKMKKLWTTTQGPSEPVRDFMDRIIAISADLSLSDGTLMAAIQAGFKPSIRQFVLGQKSESLQTLREAAVLAEKIDLPPCDVTATSEISRALQRLEEKMDRTTLAAISRDQQETHPSSRQGRSPSPLAGARHRSPTPGYQQWNFQGKGQSLQQHSGSQKFRNPSNLNFCYRCNGTNHIAQNCRHRNTVCHYCSVVGHVIRACQKRQNQAGPSQ